MKKRPIDRAIDKINGRQEVSGKIIPLDTTRAPHQAFRAIADEYGDSMKAAIGIIMNKDGDLCRLSVGGVTQGEASFMLGKLVWDLNEEWHGENQEWHGENQE